MPKAEVGSTKYIANKMKAKGLQRLRWYCQICEKQCRDENGFKQHTMSEGHVRAMLLVGEDPKKFINDYSNQFKRDFLQLLKTSHGEKNVHMNNFYQEYIRDKEHVHMNSTKWSSLTDFAKFLGKEGLCRVEEGERGLEISFIDDSPEAIRRREDVKRKERLAKGDEDLEERLLKQQMKRALAEAERAGRSVQKSLGTSPRIIDARVEPVKVSLSLGGKAISTPSFAPEAAEITEGVPIETFSAADQFTTTPEGIATKAVHDNDEQRTKHNPTTRMSFSLGEGVQSKTRNPLLAKPKNPLKANRVFAAPEKKVSNTERIMREELERKRAFEARTQGGGKRQRLV
nr:kin17-like protein [Quercus suber]